MLREQKERGWLTSEGGDGKAGTPPTRAPSPGAPARAELVGNSSQGQTHQDPAGSEPKYSPGAVGRVRGWVGSRWGRLGPSSAPGSRGPLATGHQSGCDFGDEERGIGSRSSCRAPAPHRSPSYELVVKQNHPGTGLAQAGFARPRGAPHPPSGSVAAGFLRAAPALRMLHHGKG